MPCAFQLCKLKETFSASELLSVLALPIQGDNPSMKIELRVTFSLNGLILMSVWSYCSRNRK